MDELEVIFNRVAKAGKDGKPRLFFKDHVDIAFLYATGFVDARKFTYKQWLDSFDPSKQPDGGYIISREQWLEKTKFHYDGFSGTPLDAALRARGVTHLVLTGTMTDICVLATVVGGMNREYRMTVVEDGTATLWPEIQRATLDIIRRAYGRVLSTRQIADEIGRW